MKLLINCSIYLTLLAFISCSSQDDLETLVFNHDFEDSIPEISYIDSTYTTYDKIDERFFEYNDSRNLGRFGTGGMTLNLEGLPEHQWMRISFDFFVHDKWEGNGERGNGEDVVIFNVDETNFHFSSIVNTKCTGQDCIAVQSFPNKINRGNNPENADVNDPFLPGVCHFEGEIGGSKLIKFAYRIQHSSENVRINIAAGIKDAGPDLCLKSWSIDNLKVSVISLAEIQ